METRRLRWNTMDKSEIPIARLAEQCSLHPFEDPVELFIRD